MGAAIAVNVKECLSLSLDKSKGKEINSFSVFKRLAIANISGAAGAMLPDIIEPATDYKHRKFFHSVVFGIILVIIFFLIYKKIITVNSESLRRIISYLLIGYSVHLAQDSVTPMGLPIV